MTKTSFPISINVKKGKLKMIKELMKNNAEIAEIEENNYGFSPESFVRGNYVESEPSKSFGGIWRGNPIDAKTLREKAWQRGNRK